MRWLVAFAAAAAACTVPSFGDGHLQCATNGSCPSGFYCAFDGRCWRLGSGPDLSQATLTVDMAGADLGGGGGGSGGGGGGGGGGTSSLSTCPSLNVLFCDGFEGPLFSGNWNTLNTTNGSATRDTSRAYRGAASLDSHLVAATAGSGPLATIGRNNGSVWVTNGTVYVRLWAYFPSGLSPDFNQFLVLTSLDGKSGVTLATQNGHLLLNVYPNSTYKESATAMPLDRWACLQLDVAQGAATGAVHVQLDGKTVPDISVTTNTPAIGVLYVGLNFYANIDALPDYAGWFDEVILDSRATSCAE